MGEPNTVRVPVAARTRGEPLLWSLRPLPTSRIAPEVLAGVTLLAIAIPEQLATAQLAEVPSFLAILAFIAATVVFSVVGSNPIVSVGADSTIAPLFAVALVRLAAPDSANYLVLVSATAILVGLLVMVVGLLRLGWVADFLSAPIVAGFMTGIGLTIIVHQLPDGLGIAHVTGSILHRVSAITTHLSSVNGWSAGLAAFTLLLLVVGERLNSRVPWALLGVVATTLVVRFADLASHGVATLGSVKIVAPAFRLGSFQWSDASVVVTTALTVAVVVLSQSAATSRQSADELGVEVDLNRDFVGVGAANILTGLVGSFPVDASPARTGVVRFAGGRTQLAGLVAAAGALVFIPLAPAVKSLPVAVLAGVLFYVAGRLIQVRAMRLISRVDPYELGLAIVTGLAVILIGVQEGIAVAVGLAILDQTRRSARPRALLLGRRPGTTSWAPLGVEHAAPVDHVTVLLFGAPLYFVNAGLFRTEVHRALRDVPATTHLVIDASAMTDIDYTGLTVLGAVVEDLTRDRVAVIVARAGDAVQRSLARAPSAAVRALRAYATVDEAVRAAEQGTSVAPGSAGAGT